MAPMQPWHQSTLLLPSPLPPSKQRGLRLFILITFTSQCPKGIVEIPGEWCSMKCPSHNISILYEMPFGYPFYRELGASILSKMSRGHFTETSGATDWLQQLCTLEVCQSEHFIEGKADMWMMQSFAWMGFL